MRRAQRRDGAGRTRQNEGVPRPEFRDRVITVIQGLAPGEVVSYGDVAAQAGYPGAARGVGAILANHDEPLPWWRVVMSTGRLAPGHEEAQARLLRAEGVAVNGNRVARD